MVLRVPLVILKVICFSPFHWIGPIFSQENHWMDLDLTIEIS